MLTLLDAVISSGEAAVVVTSIGETVTLPFPALFAVPFIVSPPSTNVMPETLKDKFPLDVILTFPFIPDIIYAIEPFF